MSEKKSIMSEKGYRWAKIRENGFAISIIVPGTIYLVGFFIIILCVALQYALTYRGAFPNLGNFAELGQNPEFIPALKRTVLFVLVGTPLQLAAGLLLAMIVWKPFRGRGIVRSVFILPLAITAVVTATIFFTMTSYPFGHINELLLGRHAWFPRVISTPIDFRGSAFASLGMALFAKTWRDMPISMLILLAGLEAIGEDQYEAAETLGAGGLQKFRYITLPLLLPAISTVLILRSIELWKEFIFPFFLAPQFPVLATLIDKAYHVWMNPGLACAISLVLIAFIVTFMAVLNWLLKTLSRVLVKL